MKPARQRFEAEEHQHSQRADGGRTLAALPADFVGAVPRCRPERALNI